MKCTWKGSPHDRAANWIMFEDPLGLQPVAPNLIQRYHMALFYFLTTSNGEKPWNTCNPPRENESDKCLYIGNEIEGIVNANATRWLSRDARVRMDMVCFVILYRISLRWKSVSTICKHSCPLVETR